MKTHAALIDRQATVEKGDMSVIHLSSLLWEERLTRFELPKPVLTLDAFRLSELRAGHWAITLVSQIYSVNLNKSMSHKGERAWN